MENFKVVSETGIMLEGSDTVYPTDDVLELDPETDQVKALIESGAIVAVTEDASVVTGTDSAVEGGDVTVQEEIPTIEAVTEVEKEAAARVADEDYQAETEAVAEVAPGERHPLA